jgi:hypothetical protein
MNEISQVALTPTGSWRKKVKKMEREYISYL